ncbi:hypothetical protein niasHT_003512 [Heterodera trifolii]|uniref:phospholipase A2 n=1 Tax=Heterodera trifolii TaxID=157864 RepID=A0ABD2M2S0_9BILA
MNWNSWASIVPDGNRITQIANMAQTVGQIAGAAQRLIEARTPDNVPTIGRAQTELQFSDPIIGGPPNQNLFDRFSRDFLKSLMSVGNGELSRALLDERRADRDGCTPLLCAVKRNADANGDTPLHHAVMAGSVPIVKLLLCFGADLDVPNKLGQTANGMRITNERLVEVLSRARAWSQYGICATECNSKAKFKNGREEALAKVTREQQRRAMANQRERRTAKDKGNGDALRLLSLDGGGIRGLVLIQILLELERLVDGGDTQKKGQRKKDNFIQRHFDWVAGTSTGAILALALADGTSLIDCLRLYLRLKDDVFGPEAKASRFGGYKPECLEKFLQDHFGKQRKMSDIRCGKMKIFVTATKAEQIPIELVLFRNFNSPFNGSDHHAPGNVCIWRAARYSSAAPTYFPSMDGLMDGGLIANNPSNELLKEVYLCNESAKLSIKTDRPPNDSIAFLLSLGTGRTPPVDVGSIDVVLEPSFSNIVQSFTALNNLKSILVEQLATSDGQVVESARMLCHLQKVPYFRLTPQLRVDIALDTVDNGTLIDMLWDAKAYVREQCAEDVQALVELMRERDGI